jgi:outer membrane lipoprotein-sorting protein
MNSKLILTVALCLSSVFTAMNPGEDIVKLMYKKYSGNWASTLVFDQTTEIYRDSANRTETWHEAMLFPDKLRIDIGSTEKGNTIIFRNDSTYRIRDGHFQSASPHGNDLIFLLGGMYFYPLDKTIEKIKSQGYDLSKTGEDNWQGKAVYIIGASNKNEPVSQLWVDKDDLYLVRMIKYDKNGKQDALFENYIKMGGGGAETKIMFYVNDTLRQAETYYNCKVVPEMNEGIFDPQHYEKIAH